MASKKVIPINLDVQINNLTKLKDTLNMIKGSGGLIRSDSIEVKSLTKSITELQNILKKRQGKQIDSDDLDMIARSIKNITSGVDSIITKEKQGTISLDEYNKNLEDAQKNLAKITEEYEKQKKALQAVKDIGISTDGKVAPTKQKKVIEEAAKNVSGKYSGNAKKLMSNYSIADMEKMVGLDSTKNKERLDTIAKEAGISAKSVQEAAKKALDAIEKYKANVIKQVQDAQNKLSALASEKASASQNLNAVEATKNEIINTEDVTNLTNANKAVTDYNSNLKEVSEDAKKTGANIQDMGNKVQTQSNIVSKAAKSLITYQMVYRTLRNSMKQAINTITQMDEALTTLTIVTGKSRQEVQEYIPELRKLAIQTSSTMTDVSNLTAEYVRQGRTIKDALTLAEETAKAAKIAGISTSDSLNYMTAAINGFNLAANDAEHVSDVFAKLGANAAVDYEGLAKSLSKVSAQANTAGMSIEFTSALLAKGIETTQEAPESIGTALKTIIARMRELNDYEDSLDLSSPINDVEKALQAAGVTLRTESGAFKELEDVFVELGPKWDSLSTMQQQAIAQAVAGTRQQARFLAIMQDWDRTLELVADATDAAGAAQFQYNQAAKSISSALTNLQTS